MAKPGNHRDCVAEHSRIEGCDRHLLQPSHRTVSRPTMTRTSPAPAQAVASMALGPVDMCLQGIQMAVQSAAYLQQQVAAAMAAQYQQQQQQQQLAAGTTQTQQQPALPSLSVLPGLPAHPAMLPVPQFLAPPAPSTSAAAGAGMPQPRVTLQQLLQKQQQQAMAARAAAAEVAAAVAAAEAAAVDAAAGRFYQPAQPGEQMPPAPSAAPGLFMQNPAQLQELLSQLQQQQQQGAPDAAAAATAAAPAAASGVPVDLHPALAKAWPKSNFKLKYKLLELPDFKVLHLRELRGRKVTTLTGPTVVVSDTNIEAAYIPGALLPDRGDKDAINEMRKMLDNLVVMWQQGEKVNRSGGISKSPIVLIGWRQNIGGPSVQGPYHVHHPVFLAGSSAARALTKIAEQYVDQEECYTAMNTHSTMDSVKAIRGEDDTERLPCPPPSVGGSPYTAFTLTCNYDSNSHQDDGDGECSIIAWRHLNGRVKNPGKFYLGPLKYSVKTPGACFEIGDGDVLFINTKVLFHHTERPSDLRRVQVQDVPKEPAVLGMALVYKPKTVKTMAKQWENNRVQQFADKAERCQQPQQKQKKKKQQKGNKQQQGAKQQQQKHKGKGQRQPRQQQEKEKQELEQQQQQARGDRLKRRQEQLEEQQPGQGRSKRSRR